MAIQVILTFGDKVIPPSYMPYAKIQLTTSYLFHLPIGQLVFNDYLGIFNNAVTLNDGLPVSISITQDNNNALIYYFRIFTWSASSPKANTTLYKINLIYDDFNYMNYALNTFYNGNTSSVISQIISDHASRLKTDVSPTTDTQNWYPANMKINEFCTYLCKRGYTGTGSYMMLAATLQGVLRYRNGSALAALQPTKSFTFQPSQDTSQLLLAAPIKGTSRSGVANNHIAYGRQYYQYDTTKSVYNNQNQAKFKAISPVINISKEDLAANKGNTRVDFIPKNAGNMHANYLDAVYNNKRAPGTLSLSAHVVTQTQTILDCLDVVALPAITAVSGITDATATSQSAYKGNFIIGGKTIYIIGVMYYEKFALLSTGFNTDTFSTEPSYQSLPAQTGV